MNTTLSVLLALAAVVVLGLLFRRAGGGGAAPAERGPEEGVAPSREDEFGEELDDFVDDDVEAVAVTSDGYSFLPDLHAVRIVPPAEGDEDQPWASKASDEAGRGRHRRGDAAISSSLHAGDLTDARVTRGGADEGPWRLETLGRDGEYACWSFESREGADAACSVLELRGVVKRGTDDEDRPVRHSAEAWAEARRIWEDTQAELALDLDDEPGDGRTR